MDGWSYTATMLREKAEKENPGCTYAGISYRGTGLWCDVFMRLSSGLTVERRLYF